MALVSHDRKIRLVVFHQGKRIIKTLDRTPDNVERVRSRYKLLKSQGVKAHIVCLTQSRMYPPEDEVEEMREQGMLWCPYCGAWRWFKVPKPRAHTLTPGVVSREMFLTSCWRQGTRVCGWCEISIYDHYVGSSNGIFAEVRAGRKRRRGRRRRR